MIGSNTTAVQDNAQRAVQTVRKGQPRKEQDASKVAMALTASKFPKHYSQFAAHFIFLFPIFAGFAGCFWLIIESVDQIHYFDVDDILDDMPLQCLGREKQAGGNKSLAHKNVDITKVQAEAWA